MGTPTEYAERGDLPEDVRVLLPRPVGRGEGWGEGEGRTRPAIPREDELCPPDNLPNLSGIGGHHPAPPSIILRPGVRRVVGSLEPFCGQVGVDLGRDQVRVAEQLLDAAQVGARVKEVGRVTVPQLVRRQVRVQAGKGKVLLQAQLQLARGDRC